MGHFVYNLHRLRKDAVDSKEKGEKLIKTVKKYSVLSVISVMFSTLFAFVMIFVSMTGIWTYFLSEGMAFVLCLDVFIDTICMILSLHINHKYYERLCFCCIKKRTKPNKKLTNVPSATTDKVDLSSIFSKTEGTDNTLNTTKF